MQYLVTGYDYTDKDAINRRLSVREAHMAGVEAAVATGQFLYGLALLNEAEKMIGSILVVNYSTREELDAWLAIEPYVTGKVWERIEVVPCRVAPIFMK